MTNCILFTCYSQYIINWFNTKIVMIYASMLSLHQYEYKKLTENNDSFDISMAHKESKSVEYGCANLSKRCCWQIHQYDYNKLLMIHLIFEWHTKKVRVVSMSVRTCRNVAADKALGHFSHLALPPLHCVNIITARKDAPPFPYYLSNTLPLCIVSVIYLIHLRI